MQIILKDDMKGLGYKYDVVKVKSGYARNFLIPRGFAVVANSSNLKMRDEEVRQTTYKMEKIKNDALELIAKLDAIVLSIGAKVGETGKIFGSVTSLQIADALKLKSIDIDRRKITIPSDIKTVGVYQAEIDLHRSVKGIVKFEIVAE